MKEKIKNYLDKLNILTSNEFEEISKFATFQIDISSNNKVFLNLSLEQLIPINLYLKLLKGVDSKNNNLVLQVHSKIGKFTIEDIYPYLEYFFKSKENSLCYFFSKRIVKTMDQTLFFYYFYDDEKELLKKIEKDLILFLNKAGINILKIEYQIDISKQNHELKKQKQKEEVIHTIKQMSNTDNLKAVRSDNFIKNKKTIELKDLEFDPNNWFIIEANIFNIKKTVSRNGTVIFSLDVTDYIDSLTLKVFCNRINQNNFQNRFNLKINLPENYLDSFKIGQWIRARIRLSNDQYSNNELIGLIDQIMPIDTPSEYLLLDDASKKRIELLAHTKMSSFDGLATTEEIIKRAKEYGWEAVGIVDRHNVQSFPDAQHFSKILNQKVLYGFEANVLPNEIIIVKNQKSIQLKDATYVLFDIETTGLVNEYDDIIEFGAVKVKNKSIIDRIDFFIKPSKPIPEHITSLTKITNEMVENGLPIKEALKKIIDWIGDSVLIAHNGINFDLRFINKKMEQNGFPTINNSLIDTLQLSRAINEDLTQHSLGTICRYLSIRYDDLIAHRADYDANVLFQVWNIFYHKLLDLKITNLNEINSHLQNEKLIEYQYGDYVDIYAKNQNAIPKMYQLISKSHTENLHRDPRIFWNTLWNSHKDLILANNPFEGDVWDVALNGTDEELNEVIKKYDYIFVSPPNNYLHEVSRKTITLNNVKKTILKIIRFAIKNNKLPIAVSDAYYLDLINQEAHSVYIHSKILGGKSHRLYKYGSKNDQLPNLHLRNTANMLSEFSFIDDQKLKEDLVINNAYVFLKEIDLDIKPLKTELYPPKIEGVDEKLRNLVFDNAKNIYGKNLPKLIEERLNKEVNAIINNKYSNIYWISHLLVKQSLSDGYLVGSRGSVGSSLTAYFANISEVNPLPAHYVCDHCKHSEFVEGVDDGFDLVNKLCPSCGHLMRGDGHNIPFETFLGFHAEKIPDIDLNFSGDYQPKAHEFIRKMFGEKYTYRAGTISTVAEKTAFGYVKNYFESFFPNKKIRSAHINWLVKQCKDVKRTSGQHPGGIVIVPSDMEIYNFTPYNYPAGDKTQTWFTTHFAFESLHDNLLKFDILGHDDPTTLKMLYDLTGIDPKKIPFNDKEVLGMFSSLIPLKCDSSRLLNETIGSFGLPEFGTEFVRRMLSATKPNSFADLIRISGLSHGTDVWANNAATLIKNANMNLSQVISCRDDIMVNLIRSGVEPKIAFNVMESVRKGKSIKPDDLKALKEKHIPDWYIDSCNKIQYLFPKAHATAYVIMAWRIAWYKLYHPLSFYAAYFSIRTDVFDIETIIKGEVAIAERLKDIKHRLSSNNLSYTVKQKEKDLIPIYEVALEMYVRGFKFENVNIDKSEATVFVIENKTLIPPFSAINGLGAIAAHSIIKARQKAKFISKQDLLNRTKINKTNLKMLEEYGVLDGLDLDDQMSLF